MSSPHANHQGEPGDTGSGDRLEPKWPIRILYENWRGETAVRRINLRSMGHVGSKVGLWYGATEWHPEPQWLLHALDLDKGPREFALSGIKAWGDEAIAKAVASAPTPPDRVGEEVGRELERLSAAAAPGEWKNGPRCVLAKSTNPHIGGDDVVVSVAYSDRSHSDDKANCAFIVALVNAYRSGKLVASTGSGEETKGAPASPSGHSRAEPFGLGPKDECPSRDPSAPGVLWSAWSETDADSDPSDPGATYCTEWFVGRWPIGAEEPDCRILIGTSRSAEIIARRVAEKLTSILNTDRIRLGSSGWRTDCFRTRMSEFDAAYKKAGDSSQPQDWMDAALLAQQFRNVAYGVLIGEAPRQEPPASAGWVLVPREPDDAMVQAGGSMLPPTRRLTDCYDYFREAWAAALDARPIPPGALAGEAEGRDRQGSVHEHAAPQGAAPEATPQQSPSPTTETDPWVTLRKIAELRHAEDACEPFDEALDLADAALRTLQTGGEVR